MSSKKESIQFLAGSYITRLMAKQLPPNLLFHNFHHTANVVRGVQIIGKRSNLTAEQLEILVIAAWFHDSGHIHTYKGHELESQKLATAFLEKKGYPNEKLVQVLDCIAATTMPQRPKNMLEKVICDADLYHLSLEEYPHLQHQLREEWERVLDKKYTEEAWQAENLTFLQNHQYFTDYGQQALQKRKLKNIQNFQAMSSLCKTN